MMGITIEQSVEQSEKDNFYIYSHFASPWGYQEFNQAITQINMLLNNFGNDIAIVLDFRDVPEWRTLSMVSYRSLVSLANQHIRDIVFIDMPEAMMNKLLFFLSQRRNKSLAYNLFFLDNLAEAQDLLETKIETHV